MKEIVDPIDSNIKPVTQDEAPKIKRWKGVIVLCLLVALIGGISYWSFMNKRAQAPLPSDQTVEPQTKKDTTLTIATDEASRSSSMTTIPITIDTGENSVSAVELHITFSPIPKQIISLQPSTFFANPTILKNDIDQASGTATLILGSLTPTQGEGIVGIITLRNQTPQNTIQISFTEKTRAAAINEKDSVIKELISGSL